MLISPRNWLKLFVTGHSINLLGLVPGSPEWCREISLSKFGFQWYDSIRISPDGVKWGDNEWLFDPITNLTWYPYGSAWVQYHFWSGHIVLGDADESTPIKTTSKTLYLDIIDRLVKAIGLRLVAEYCGSLEEGMAYRFGDAYLVDHGMLLPKINLIGGKWLVYCPWKDIRFSRRNESLAIKSHSQAFTGTTLRDKKVDNTDTLANALVLLKEQQVVLMRDLLNVEAGSDKKKTLRTIVEPFGSRILPGALSQADQAFVFDAIESSQQGRYVNVKTIAPMLIFSYAAIAALALAIFGYMLS